MAQLGALVRGFKAKAEKIAVNYRKELLIHPCGSLCAFKLAEHLNIPVYEATEFLKLPKEIARLSGVGEEDCGWSALTMITQAGNTIIIHNPYHSPARQQSNMMHELAHIICKHSIDLSKYDMTIPIGMTYFNEIQEEEAKCLGATLQMPRPGLLWAMKRNMDKTNIALHFNASVDMVTYRLNTTGVFKQTRRIQNMSA